MGGNARRLTPSEQTILDHITRERKNADNHVNKEMAKVHKRLDSMDQRLSNVETDVNEIKDRLTNVEDGVAEIKSVYNLPDNHSRQNKKRG